jgi:hypothetical protein
LSRIRSAVNFHMKKEDVIREEPAVVAPISRHNLPLVENKNVQKTQGEIIEIQKLKRITSANRHRRDSSVKSL